MLVNSEMLTAAVRTWDAARNAGKCAWRNDPLPEEPVPETAAGLRAAVNAARAAADGCFRARDLYDAVRAVGRHVLVSPSTEALDDDVAALCAMAGDVCNKPVAVLAPSAAVADAYLHLGVEVTVDVMASAAAWDAAGLRGVIVVALCDAPPGLRDALESGVVRCVLQFTGDRYAHDGPAVFSPGEHWTFSADTVAHRGSRAVVTAGLRALWRQRSRDAWADDCDARMAPRDCVICMDTCRGQIVSACCTAAFCAGCAERWVQQAGTCPGCRSPADYTTLHRITIND